MTKSSSLTRSEIGGWSSRKPAAIVIKVHQLKGIDSKFSSLSWLPIYEIGLTVWLSHGRELKGDSPPIRWLHGPHRLHHHAKSSTVLSATRYEGTSGYVTPVNNCIVLSQPLNFNTRPADLTNRENDETENCPRPEQGREASEAAKFSWEKEVIAVVKYLYKIPFGYGVQISILSHVIKVQNALASWPSYICADLWLPNIIVCSTEHHLGVRIPDAANVARMASVDWDLLRMMHTAEENRAPRVHANPMFQYFFFWLAWTLVLLSIPCFNACVRPSQFKMSVFRTNIKNMKTISRYTALQS